MPQMDAKASVALVTGATGGIGKEIARQLGAAGWSVLVGARDSARGAKAVAEVGGPDDGPTGQLFSWDGTVAPW